MRERHAYRQRRRAQEFEAFVAGAAGRLLHTATLLTAEPAEPAAPAEHAEPAERAGPTEHAEAAAPAAPPQAGIRAERLLTAALTRTYADWDRLRGEDPYDRTRQDLATRFARTPWRHHRPHGGVLDELTPQERLVLVLRLYEGVAEEQTAALLGLPADRVRAVCARAVATMRSSPARRAAAASGAANPGSRPDLPDRRTDEVRRMLEGPHPQVPAALVLRATEQGTRLLRRRRALSRLAGWAMWAAMIVFLVWAAVTQPWVDPPAETTPPLDGW